MDFCLPPSQAGFLTFLRTVGEFDVLVLPDSAPVIPAAYQIALSTVDLALACAPPAYTLAVYNLGTDRVINYSSDQQHRTFFKDLRKLLGINVFVPGVLSGSSDSGTSASNNNPQFMSRFTMSDLQNLKTSFGREYLALAQTYGPNIWGLT